MISEKRLNILKVCFWLNILTFIIIVSFIIVTMGYGINGTKPYIFLSIIISILNIPLFFLCGNSFYFFYKYDKYSKSGIYFLFFHILYAHIYFYKVIWKKKRELINSYKQEEVLGNKIFIETEEDS